MCNFPCILVWAVLGLVALIIGMACLIVAAKTPTCVSTPSIVSVPLCPTCNTSAYVCDLYVGSTLVDQCSASPESITLNISSAGIQKRSYSQTAYLLHNLFGIAGTLEILSPRNESVLKYEMDRNMDYNTAVPWEEGDYVYMPDFLSCFDVNDFYRVSCPSRTLATDSLGIDPYCESVVGYPTRLEGRRVVHYLGAVDYEVLYPWFLLVFSDLRVRPTDFTTPPELFFATDATTNWLKLLISGGVFAGLAGVDLIVLVLIVVLGMV